MALIPGEYVASPITNATMQEILRDGTLYRYSIEAADGYVLHDKRVDVPAFDPETLEPTGEVTPWFKTGATTVPASYDFANVTPGTYTYTDENGMAVTVPVSMIGMYEFYTVPADIVPTSQTCGDTNDHETI